MQRNRIGKSTGVEVDFKIVGYSSVSELKQALSRGEVDILFANFRRNKKTK